VLGVRGWAIFSNDVRGQWPKAEYVWNWSSSLLLGSLHHQKELYLSCEQCDLAELDRHTATFNILFSFVDFRMLFYETTILYFNRLKSG